MKWWLSMSRNHREAIAVVLLLILLLAAGVQVDAGGSYAKDPELQSITFPEGE